MQLKKYFARVSTRALSLALALVLFITPAFAASDVEHTAGDGTYTVLAGVTTLQCDAIGSGGGGWWSGGGGGAWSQTTGLAVTPGQIVYYHVGHGVQVTMGEDSWANISSNAAPTTTAQGCLAKGGQFQTGDTVASQGGQSSSGVGTSKFSGGNAGNPTTDVPSGAGSAAGPDGAGGNGSLPFSGVIGGGSGGADGGGNATDGTSTHGGNGGTLTGGVAGVGATASTDATSGTNGAGAGGGFGSAGSHDVAGNGSDKPIWGIYGPGSGGGGGDTAGSGGHGGGEGGGVTNAAAPGDGLIIFTYTASGGAVTRRGLGLLGVGQ